MPITDNHKSEFLETVETLSEFAGILAGKAVACSREISDCVKNMMDAKLELKPESSAKTAESIKSQAKKKLAEMEKKKPATEQDKLKEKTEKTKPSAARAKSKSTKSKSKTTEN